MFTVTLFKNSDYTDEWGTIEIPESSFDKFHDLLRAIYNTLPHDRIVETSANEIINILIAHGIKSFLVEPEVKFIHGTPTKGSSFELYSSRY